MWCVGCIFAALLLKKHLFLGFNERDQVDLIFQIIGTPTEMTWPEVTSLRGMKRYLLSSSPSHVGCLRDKFTDISEKGFKLLER